MGEPEWGADDVSAVHVLQWTFDGVQTLYMDAGFNASGLDISHTATINDDHAVEIFCDAAGFGDVKALDIAYTTGAITTGEIEGVILVNVDAIAALGGNICGLEMLSTDGASLPDEMKGLRVGAGIGPVGQASGTFANPTTGTNNTTSTDIAGMIDGSAGTNTTIFVADNDYVLIGAAAEFTEIEFRLLTPVAMPGVQPTFEYSTAGAHQFTTFSPTDGTNGFTNTGVIAWESSQLTGHTTNDDTGTFDIKITRTHNSRGSVVMYFAKTAATVEYSWDKDGNVTVNDATLNDVSVNELTSAGDVGVGTATPGSVLPPGSIASSRVLEVSSESASIDTILSLGCDTPTIGTDIWLDRNAGDTYIDNRYDHALGDIHFRTRTDGTPVDALTITGTGEMEVGGDLELADTINIVVSTTTGTQIATGATQKLGFYGVTPVVQQATIIDADGNLADITTKFNTLLAELEALGLLANA